MRYIQTLATICKRNSELLEYIKIKSRKIRRISIFLDLTIYPKFFVIFSALINETGIKMCVHISSYFYFLKPVKRLSKYSDALWT